MDLTERSPVVRFTVPGVPGVKARARGGRNGFYTPKGTVAAEEKIAWCFRQAKPERTPDPRLAYGVEVTFHLPGLKRQDVDNMLKLLLDGLNKVAWPDDNQVTEIIARKEGGTPKDSVRTEVYIYTLGPLWVATKALSPRTARRAAQLLPEVPCAHCQKPCETAKSRSGGGYAYCSQVCMIEFWRANPSAAKVKRSARCPDCGQPKTDARSKRCRACAVAALRVPNDR